jgi:hypothetical protein
VEALADALDTYTNREIEKAVKKRQDNRAEQLGDQRDAVIAIIEGLPEDARTVYEVIAVIRKLFTDEGAATRPPSAPYTRRRAWSRTPCSFLTGT